MFSKRLIVLVVIFLIVFLLLPLAPVTQAELQEPAATVIVVDSGTDPDNNMGRTCLTHSPCTLRRAIVQANDDDTERPVAIKFNIPKDAANGYNSTVGVWELEPQSTNDLSVFRTLEGGQMSIDGTTQPGGRSSGPKIILVGPTKKQDGIKVGINGAGKHDHNEIRGLGFQNFRTHIVINSNYNLITENWFGLTSDGKEPYLRNDDPDQGTGAGGVWFSAGTANNSILENVFLGLNGTAVTIRGNKNVFSDNLVGMRADGKIVDKETESDQICTKVDWLGGGGVSLEGDDHEVSGNIIAGLRLEVYGTAIQPDSISATGSGHKILDNQIGRAKDGAVIGDCGRGIYLHGSPKGMLVQNNEILNPGLSGISLNGAQTDAITLRSNIIKSRFPWTDYGSIQVPEDAVQLGKSLSPEYRSFKPARVAKIEGTKVSGTSGTGSPCPKCVVELFLDDNNAIKEALKSLAVVTADENGNWTAQIPSALGNDQRLRTTSTTAKFNTIHLKDVGTTTGLSEPYSAAVPVAHIIVDKVTKPIDDPQLFVFRLAGGPDSIKKDFKLKDASAPWDSGPLKAGSFKLTETIPAGWFLTTVTCDDGSDPANITISAGETVTCTFANTAAGQIVVDKVTDPSGVTQSFSFKIIGGPGAISKGFTLTDTAAPWNSGDLLPGTYSVAETVPTGWTLTKSVCSDGSNHSAIILEPGEQITCTFGNKWERSLLYLPILRR